MNGSPEINPLRSSLRKFFRGIKLGVRNDPKRPLFFDALEGHSYTSSQTMNFVTLTELQGALFSELVERLSLLHTKSRSFGKKFAKKCIEEAIWKVIDSKEDAATVARVAAQEVIAQFDLPRIDWDIYLPVSGFETRRSAQWKFGKVQLIPTTSRRFKQNVKSSVNKGLIVIDLSAIKYWAYLKVTAIDSESAVALATQEISLHLNILNGLACLGGIAKHDTVISHYGLVGEKTISFVIYGHDERLGWKRFQTIPLAGITPHLLRSSSFMELLHPRIIEKRLVEYDNTFYIEHVFPALRWVGTAITSGQGEEAFLFYFLALESIFFEADFRGNVTQELKRRIVRLLFSNRTWLSSSVEAFSKFDSLYELRSNIVHRGGAEIRDEDLKLVHELVLGTIYKIMHHSFFRKMKSSKEFESWLIEDTNEAKS